jgi:hypothetical protein
MISTSFVKHLWQGNNLESDIKWTHLRRSFTKALFSLLKASKAPRWLLWEGGSEPPSSRPFLSTSPFFLPPSLLASSEAQTVSPEALSLHGRLAAFSSAIALSVSTTSCRSQPRNDLFGFFGFYFFKIRSFYFKELHHHTHHPTVLLSSPASYRHQSRHLPTSTRRSVHHTRLRVDLTHGARAHCHCLPPHQPALCGGFRLPRAHLRRVLFMRRRLVLWPTATLTALFSPGGST